MPADATPSDFKTRAKSYLKETSAILERLSVDTVDRIFKILCDAYRDDRQVILMGNGGSAALASHFAVDLGKGTVAPGRRRFRVVSIVDNTPVLPLPDPTPVSPEGLEWRETFLVAATRLINQRGYRGASVEEISAALNVTKGSFYHHHDDKDALVAECFERTFTVTRRSQLDARDLPADNWTRLVSTAAGLTSYQLSEHGPLLRASSLGALPDTLRHDMADGYMRGWQRFASIISDGVADGSIRPIDPSIAAHMINSMLNAAASLGAWVPGLERDEAADLFARPLLTGVLN